MYRQIGLRVLTLCLLLYCGICSAEQVVYSNIALTLSAHNGIDAKINSLDYSPDGKLLAIGLKGRPPEIWSIADGKQLEIIAIEKYPANSDSNVVWSSDGTALIVGVGTELSTTLFARYDRDTKKASPILPAYHKRLLRLKKIGGNRVLVLNQTREGYGELAIVDLQGQLQVPRDFVKQDLFGAAATTDGSFMAAQVNKAFVVYDSQGQLVHRHEPKDGGANFSIAFSPDGKRLAMVSFKKIEILDLASKSIVATFPGKFPHPEAFYSPDGKHLLLVGEKLVILDAESGVMKSENGFSQGITAAYAPNGQGIAIARLGEEANMVDCWSMTLPVNKSLVPAGPVVAQNAADNPMTGAAGQVGQSTPEDAAFTYCQSIATSDWDTFFKVADAHHQGVYTRALIVSLAEEGFPSKKDPMYQTYIDNRKELFKSSGLRDLTIYAGKKYTPTEDDLKAIDAISDKLVCVKKIYAMLRTKEVYKLWTEKFSTFKVESKQTVGSYEIIYLVGKKLSGPTSMFVAFEKTSQGWIASGPGDEEFAKQFRNKRRARGENTASSEPVTPDPNYGFQQRHQFKSAGEMEPTGTLESIALSPDGKQLAIGFNHNPIQLWDLTKPGKIASIPLKPFEDSDVNFMPTMSWSPDGKTIAISSSAIDGDLGVNQCLTLYNVAAKRVTKLPKQKGGINHLVWAGTDQLLLSAGGFQKYQLTLSKVAPWKQQFSIPLKESTIYGLAVSPDLSQVACAFETNGGIYDAAGKEVAKIDLRQHGNAHRVAFSPDGKQVVYACSGSLILFDIAGKKSTPLLEEGGGYPVLLQYTFDGKLILVASSSGFKVVDSATGRVIFKSTGNFDKACLSEDMKTLVTASDNDMQKGTFTVWDLKLPLGPSLLPALPVAAAAPENKPAPAPAAKSRFWTSADGMFKIEAEFVQQKQGFVQLKRKDTGALVSIPIAKLSEEDQELLRTLP